MPFHFRWPGGHRVGLEPEEDEPEASEVMGPDEDEEPIVKATKAKAKATSARASKAKANAKSRVTKSVPVSDGGRSVTTDYYNHRTLNDMPAGS